MIPKRRKPEPMGLRHNERIRSPGHLKWVRGHECSIKDKISHVCIGKIVAAHVRKKTDGAHSMKPSDRYTIPLCVAAHDEQHKLGEPGFEKKYGITMRGIADALWQRSPYRIKYEKGKAA